MAEHIWKFEEYSNWSQQLAIHHTVKELQKVVDKCNGERARLSESRLNAIRATSSMTSQSQRRAQTRNSLDGTMQKLTAHEHAIELHALYPEKCKVDPAPTSKRLNILTNSLTNKEEHFKSKLDEHFATVKEANGQPLNDKRNGQATLNKWERQGNTLRTIEKGIAKTKSAIEREEGLLLEVAASRKQLPQPILDLLDSGAITQWRRHPNRFFVKDIPKARIVWLPKKKTIGYKFLNALDKEQYSAFAKTYNALRMDLRLELTKEETAS